MAAVFWSYRVKADFVVTKYLEKKMGFLFEDQNLTEARFYSDDLILGSICTATVDKIVPSVDAAFLNGPDGQIFFYPLKENEGRHLILRRRGEKENAPLRPGDTLLVQVSGEAQKKKLAATTARLSLYSDAVIVNLTGEIGISKKIRDTERREALRTLSEELLTEYESDGFGVIIRTAAEHLSDDEYKEVTIRLLCKLKEMIRLAETTPEHRWLYQTGADPKADVQLMSAKGLYESITVHTDLPWEEPENSGANGSGIIRHCDGYQLHQMTGSPLVIFNIPVLMEKALARKVFLKSGGYLYVETTEAMTVIDVNSGKNITGKDHESGALVQNLEAAEEIARLLRLRNISGIIMIDFINMKRGENDRKLLSAFRGFVSRDNCHVHVVDITRLGIVEVTREKKSPPLSELLNQAAVKKRHYIEESG